MLNNEKLFFQNRTAMLVSDMTAVMTSLVRIVIGCLRGVCRCCQRLPVQVIANNHHKTRTQFERRLTNVITFHSYHYCCTIFS